MLHGSPWLYTDSNCHQMITSKQPNGPQELLEVTQNRDCQPTHASPKTADYSPVGPHRGADLGNSEIPPGIAVIS